MTNHKDTLVHWLRDAHAMERATIDNIERLLDRMKDYPAVCERYRQHLDESRQQLERLDTCLHDLGTDSSSIKDTATRVLGVAQVYATGAANDEPMKHCLAAYAYEHFEIASYEALIEAADLCGMAGVREACEMSLNEERAMADWLDKNLRLVARQYLQQTANVS
jgi:ferritin-like metal-binding protein YciE